MKKRGADFHVSAILILVGRFQHLPPRGNELRPLLDEIDRVLAAHYGFTEEESDFPSTKLRTGPSIKLRASIPSARLRAGPSTKLRAGPSTKLRAGNYDIKYRMGRDAESEEG